MNQHIFVDGIQIVLSAILGCALFQRARVRARWAKLVFLLLSVIGISTGAFELAWNLGWFTFSRDVSCGLDRCLALVDGVAVGFLLCLMFSGELHGKKQPPNTALEPTPTAP
jgi:hypothetical protein